MPTQTVSRAWADVEFRSRLTVDELQLVPEHPAGDIDVELNQLVAKERTGPSTVCTEWTNSPWCCC
jgi:mersacidin/lichenicidin family type 2 lantibiotic